MSSNIVFPSKSAWKTGRDALEIARVCVFPSMLIGRGSSAADHDALDARGHRDGKRGFLVLGRFLQCPLDGRTVMPHQWFTSIEQMLALRHSEPIL